MELVPSYLENLPHQNPHTVMDLTHKDDVKYPDIWSSGWENGPWPPQCYAFRLHNTQVKDASPARSFPTLL